jgi:hypothetical protein
MAGHLADLGGHPGTLLFEFPCHLLIKRVFAQDWLSAQVRRRPELMAGDRDLCRKVNAIEERLKRCRRAPAIVTVNSNPLKNP